MSAYFGVPISNKCVHDVVFTYMVLRIKFILYIVKWMKGYYVIIYRSHTARQTKYFIFLNSIISLLNAAKETLSDVL